jgi:hypothetical protein
VRIAAACALTTEASNGTLRSPYRRGEPPELRCCALHAENVGEGFAVFPEGITARGRGGGA